MRIILKFLILIFKDYSIFSAPFLRVFRWWLYRKYFNAPSLYVDTGVTISIAHSNNESRIQIKGEVNIGKYAYIDYSGGIVIGNRVAISENAKLYTHNHDIHDGFEDWHENEITFSKLNIDDFVWVGAGSIILPTVSNLGKGSIVAAGAVLTQNTIPFGIYAGNPAKLIGTRRINE